MYAYTPTSGHRVCDDAKKWNPRDWMQNCLFSSPNHNSGHRSALPLSWRFRVCLKMTGSVPSSSSTTLFMQELDMFILYVLFSERDNVLNTEKIQTRKKQSSVLLLPRSHVSALTSVVLQFCFGRGQVAEPVFLPRFSLQTHLDCFCTFKNRFYFKNPLGILTGTILQEWAGRWSLHSRLPIHEHGVHSARQSSLLFHESFLYEGPEHF